MKIYGKMDYRMFHGLFYTAVFSEVIKHKIRYKTYLLLVRDLI